MSDDAHNRKPLAGQSAIVTGSRSDIEARIARTFAAAGLGVFVYYAGNQHGMDAVVHQIIAAGDQRRGGTTASSTHGI